ncbi:MAG: hypothetical protein DRK00_00995 [Thermoprotei archaeon]|nr:MAG: hypothetical protein DRK00_00995 [Thermoprotei archaeon]
MTAIRLGLEEPVIKPEMLITRASTLPKCALLVFTKYSFRAAKRFLDEAERIKLPAPHWGPYGGP